MKTVGFGDFLIHFSPIGDERFVQTDLMQMSFTGAEANVCAALSYWGESTEFVTRVPEHSLAKKGINFLRGIGVKTDNIPKGEGRMGVYYLENGRSLRPSYVIYDRDNSAFTNSVFSDYNWDEIFKDANSLFLSGVTPSLSKNMLECSVLVLKEARKRGLNVFFDLNYRSALCSFEQFKEMVSMLVPYITHIIGNEEHFKMALGVCSEYGEEETCERIEDLTEKIRTQTGIDNIAVTVRRTITASETVVCAGYRQKNEFAMRDKRRIQIVDRVGSGDAFSAGIVYAHNKGLNVKDCVNFAAAAYDIKHTVTKDINFATVEEINNLANSGNCDVKR